MKDTQTNENAALIHLQDYAIHGDNIDVVSAHDLHEALLQPLPLNHWIASIISDGHFKQDIDYFMDDSGPSAESLYLFSVTMVKELCVLAGNQAGHDIRHDLINRERHQREQQLADNGQTLEAQESEKYQKLNRIILSMGFQGNPVIIPSGEVTNMIHAIRMYQRHIERLKTPDWVNESLDNVKHYTGRSFADY